MKILLKNKARFTGKNGKSFIGTPGKIIEAPNWIKEDEYFSILANDSALTIISREETKNEETEERDEAGEKLKRKNKII